MPPKRKSGTSGRPKAPSKKGAVSSDSKENKTALQIAAAKFSTTGELQTSGSKEKEKDAPLPSAAEMVKLTEANPKRKVTMDEYYGKMMKEIGDAIKRAATSGKSKIHVHVRCGSEPHGTLQRHIYDNDYSLCIPDHHSVAIVCDRIATALRTQAVTDECAYVMDNSFGVTTISWGKLV